jgi:hypothetical protein
MAYIITFSLSVLFFFIAEKFLSRKGMVLGFIFSLIAILVPSIVAACRDLEIGRDTSNYVLAAFKTAQLSESLEIFLSHSSLEPLYNCLTYTISLFTTNIAWLLFSIQFIIVLLVYLSVYKLRQYAPIWFFMFIYLFVFYNPSLNITRQTLAMAFCLYSFSFLIEHKLLKSFIVFLPAIGFHSTAFIYLSVYLIFYFVKKVKNTREIRLYQIFGIIISISIISYLSNIIDILISTGILSDKFYTYASDDRWGSSFPIKSFVYSVFIFFILNRVSSKKQIKDYLLFRMLFLISIIFCFAGLVSTIAERGGWYFLFLSILIIPIVLYDHKKIRKPYIRIFPFILLFFLFYWYMAIVVMNLSDTYPYTSSILGI